MPDRVVVQWDKDDCADMGLIKVDLLGLGMMAVIQDALELVNTNAAGSRDRGFAVRKDSDRELRTASSSVAGPRTREPRTREPADREPAEVDLAHLPPDDPGGLRMLQEADTVGIFQVESRAQMATLPRLRPVCFYDIVVEVAIIRPGPIVGQMVHPYLKRRQGAEPVSYPHPSLQPILAAHAGGAVVPGAAAAHGDGRGGIFRRRSRGAAAGVRVQAIRKADGAGGRQAARGDGAAGDHRRRRPRRSSARSRRSRCTDFPSRTPRASRCWSTPARI